MRQALLRRLTRGFASARPFSDASLWAVGAEPGWGQTEPGWLRLGHPAAFCGEPRLLRPLWLGRMTCPPCCAPLYYARLLLVQPDYLVTRCILTLPPIILTVRGPPAGVLRVLPVRLHPKHKHLLVPRRRRPLRAGAGGRPGLADAPEIGGAPKGCGGAVARPGGRVGGQQVRRWAYGW